MRWAHGAVATASTTIVAAVLLAAVLLATVPARAVAVDPDPFVGTGGRPPWLSGNTTPAAAAPFGMVQLGPDTTSHPDGSPSSTASGYAATDELLRGFSPTHLSGAGCRAFGDVPVLPVVGRLPRDPARATRPVARASERAGSGWYAVRVPDAAGSVGVRLTAGLRSGLSSYVFPAHRRARLLVKASGSLAGASAARVRFVSRRELVVSVTSGGFCGTRGDYRVHVAMQFDRPVVDRGRWRGSEPGAWVAFDTRDRRRVRVRTGVSFVDPAGARGNLDAEPGWSWERLRDRTAATWERELSRVTATGGTSEEQRMLATSMRQVMLSPMTLDDADRRYPGFDGEIHRVPRGRHHYTALAGWDAYRTHLPLLAWLRPDVASDVVESLRRVGQQGGWLPRWPLVDSYTGVMSGDSAAPMAATAWAFGARDVALDDLVARLVRQATDTAPTPGQGWFVPRPGLAAYVSRGFVPTTPDYRIGASTTLEYAVDDFALSRLALAAGDADTATVLHHRSGTWRTLWDAERGLILPRDDAGDFPGPDDEVGRCCYGFDEGNAVQYTWNVPHDMAGLLELMGPEARSRLADYLSVLNLGAGYPHAWLGNQPSFDHPWVWHWLGQPARTQDTVDRGMRLWQVAPDGLPGNEDLGSLSAWWVWSALGLHPLTPGTADVALGRPVFDRVVVTPSQGARTEILRVGAGRHVAAANIDGGATTRSWTSWTPQERPGSVVISTTDADDPDWGRAPGDRPRSWPAP